MIPILYLKIMLCVPFLLYACYTDVKFRMVRNKVWAVMLPLIIPFIIFDLVTHNTTISLLIVSFSLTFIATYTMASLNILGGADAKLIIILSLLFSKQPGISILTNHTQPIFAFSLLGNAVLITALWFLILRIYRLTNKKYVVPKDLPFMISILIGFIIALVVGDVLLHVLHPVYCLI